MTSTVVKTLKYTGLFFLVFISFISCDKQFNTIGLNLVNNTNFTTNKLTSEVITSNIPSQAVPTNSNTNFLLGVYSDPEFGMLKTSIATQLYLPSVTSTYNYGTNYGIDSVLISIPYISTQLANYSDGKPQFKIDSTAIIGNQDIPFQIKVYELKTFLNTLDPSDPTKGAVYYSDKNFSLADTPLYSGSFKVNPDDTVAYINRYNSDKTIYTVDTIKQSTKAPTIYIPLDKNMIQQLFVDNASGAQFQSLDAFYHYFRGLYIEADELSNPQSNILSLNLATASMKIFYSDDENEIEGQDLNGNGVTGEQNVRVKHTYDFLFGPVKANVYKRDETNSKQSGNNRLYIQGAGGPQATVQLSNDLLAYRDQNWLITDASLTFYVDQNASSDIAPTQLFLYDYTNHQQIRDAMSEGITKMGGLLENDANGKPYKYVFKITDYISQLLKTDKPLDLVTLGIKTYNSSDAPVSYLDTITRDNSWNPRGVVLYDANPSAGENRVKLEVSYSKKTTN